MKNPKNIENTKPRNIVKTIFKRGGDQVDESQKARELMKKGAQFFSRWKVPGGFLTARDAANVVYNGIKNPYN